MFAAYVIKSVVKGLINPSYISHSRLHKGWICYKEYRGEKKNLWRVYMDCRFLYNNWNAFPDSYFIFGMFVKGYEDKNKMLSFVPQDAYNRINSKQITDKRYNLLIDDKIICHDLLSYYGIPVPERLFVFKDGLFQRKNRILSDNEVNEILARTRDNYIFVKKNSGGGASGISVLHHKNTSLNMATVYGNADVRGGGIDYQDDKNIDVCASMLREKYKGHNIIFERQIMQSEPLRAFNPDSVNTIRIFTWKNKIRAATVRFGAKGAFVDNIAKGGVAVNVNIENGALGDYGMRKFDVKRYYKHPDTNVPFKGVVIPEWDRIIRIVEDTLLFMPYYNSVGFDVATTDNGPLIIEINTGAGIFLSQMGLEYGLAEIIKIK